MKSLFLPPLQVGSYPPLKVSPVCYQCLPHSPLPLQLGFLFTCWGLALTIQLSFLIPLGTRPSTMGSHPNETYWEVYSSCLRLPAPEHLRRHRGPVTNQLGISYHYLVFLGFLLREWQAAHEISSFISKTSYGAELFESRETNAILGCPFLGAVELDWSKDQGNVSECRPWGL